MASAAEVRSIREISEDDHNRQERESSHCHHPRVSDRSGSPWFDAGDRSDSCHDYCDSEPRNPVHGYLATRYEPVDRGALSFAEESQRCSTANRPRFRELPERASNRMLICGHELSSERGVRAARSNRNVGDDRLGNWPSRSSPPRPRVRRREMAEDEGHRYRPAGRWYDLRSGATLVRSTWHRQERNKVQKANRRQIGACLPIPRQRAVPHPRRRHGGHPGFALRCV